jgi:hypothetical protein
MHESLRRKLQEAHRRDMGGRIGSVRASVLGLVVAESYDQAREHLGAYIEHKEAYPGFQQRAERYKQHCCELIQAIQTKRNFPGLASLSLAKQQEIHEKVLQHFEELKQNLKQIEKVEREHKVNDLRSTVWVLRAVCQVVAGLLVVTFIMDLQTGLFSSFFQVLNAALDDASTWVVNLAQL